MAGLRTAEIVAVGSELLTPHRIDTNSLWLSGVLNELGLAVRMKSVVGDDAAVLSEVIRSALLRADVIITTGGLGPTDDDLTREVVAEVLGRALHEDAEVLALIAARFAGRGMPMPAVNQRQANVIDGARWLPNDNGTAPGQLIALGDRLLVLLPGPPRELQPMFRDSVAPVLRPRAEGRRLRRRVVRTTGRSESQIEELAQPVYSQFLREDPSIETTVLASPGLIELHVSASGPDESIIDRALERAVARLCDRLGDVVVSTDGRSIEQVVGARLLERGWRVAAAESCTGGLLTTRLTDVPGSSAWVQGGVVAYANDVKMAQLGVDAEQLRTDGAVSESVARAMADGIRARMKTEIGVAITGIAGPDGGSEDKPVGTVWIAVSGPRAEARRFLFPGDRTMVRMFSAAAALDMVRRQLMDAAG